MKEFKFRGRTKSGKFVYGDLIHKDETVQIRTNKSFRYYEVDPESIRQFVGRDKDGNEVAMKSICGVKIEDIIAIGIAEDGSVFKIELICLGGVHVFAEYPTLEKAERFFYDLAYKIDHSRKSMKLPPNFALFLNRR